MASQHAARRAGAFIRFSVTVAAAALMAAATAVSAQPLRDAPPYAERPSFSLPSIGTAAAKPVPATRAPRLPAKPAIFHSTPSRATTVRQPNAGPHPVAVLAPTADELLVAEIDGSELRRYRHDRKQTPERALIPAVEPAAAVSASRPLAVVTGGNVDLAEAVPGLEMAGRTLAGDALLVLDGEEGRQQVRATDRVTGRELAALPLPSDLRVVGLAADAARGSLFTLVPARNEWQERSAHDGTVLARWPLAPAGTTPFTAGQGDLVLRDAGRVWITGDGEPRLREFSVGGVWQRDLPIAGFLQDGDGHIDTPTSVATIPGSPDLWVAGYEAIYRFDPEAPVIESFTAEVLAGETTLKWTALNADDCTASEGWAGRQAVTGEQVMPSVRDAETTYTLTCGDGERSDSREVIVAAATTAGFVGPDAGQVRVGEDAGSVTVFVSRTGDSVGAVSVDFATQDSSAIAGLDYTAVSGTLRWDDGDVTTRAVTIPILADDLTDPNEAFTLLFLNEQGGVGLRNGGVTIFIDENASAGFVQFTASTQTVSEAVGTAQVQVVRSGGSRGAISVDYATLDFFGAQAGLDFTAVSGTLNWADGDVAPKTIEVPIVDDVLSDPFEGFAIELSNPANGAQIGFPQTTFIQIDESLGSAGFVQFIANQQTVSEAVGTARIQVIRTGGSRGAISVDFTTLDFFGAQVGVDFTAVSGTLNWADGDVAPKTIEVPIVDDLLTDPNEALGLELRNPGNGAQLGFPQVTVVQIDESLGSAGFVQFVAGQQTVSEAVGAAQVQVIRTGGSRGAVSVEFVTQDSNAQAGLDYTAVSGTLNWADGDAEPKTIHVPIVDDLLTDPSEAFLVALSNPGNGVQLGSLQNTFVVIDENLASAGFVQLVANQQTVSEAGGSALLQVARVGGSRGAISVDFATQDSNAQAGLDYTAVSGTLNWADGDVEPKTIQIPIIDDLLTDPNEAFSVTISNPGGGALLGFLTTSFIVIDEGSASAGFVGFMSSVLTVSEAGGTADLQVVRTGGSRGAISVAFATQDSSAQAGLDYTAVAGTLNWANGDIAPKSITVSIANDGVVDPNESFVVRLSDASNGVQLARDSIAVELAEPNGDVPLIGFSADGYTVEETAGLLTVAVKRTGSGAGAVSVDYRTQFFGAQAGLDYIDVAGTLTWAAGDMAPKTFTLPILADNLSEPDETVLLALSNPTGGAQLSRSSAFATILNRDGGGVLNLDADRYAVAEDGGALTITVNRSSGSRGAVSINYGTQTSSAQGGLDYTDVFGTLTWADGDAAPKTFTVPILDDNLSEADEVFFVTLSDPTGGAQLNTSFAFATIVNRDGGGVLSFTADRYTVAETDGLMRVTVARTGGSSGAISVDYATTSNAAQAGLDYAETGGMLTWADGDSTPRSFTVPIIDDNLSEPDESFFLTLGNPTGGAQLGGSFAFATIVNRDGGGVLNFDADQYAVSELDGMLTITVTRSGGSRGAISVDYATSSSQAQGGLDYTEVAGTLIWADGDSAPKTFTVPILDDNLSEPDELFVVTLGNPTGGAQVNRGFAVASILNRDGGGALNFSADGYTVAESDGVVTVSVIRTGGSRGAVSVDYATLASSAQPGVDYLETSGTLNWADGDIAPKSITVPLIDDNLSESNELLFLSLGGATGGAVIGRGFVGVTVLDQGGGGFVHFSTDATSVSESGGSVTLTVARSSGQRGAVSVDFTTRPFSNATPGEDYEARSGTLNWPDGDASPRNITIPILDDGVTEGDESFFVELQDAAGGTQIGTPQFSLVTIREQASAGVLQFDPAGYRVSEDGGSVSLTVTRTGGRLGAVSVRYDTQDASAQAGLDYQPRSGTLTWTDGDLAPKSFSVPIVASLFAEPQEIFFARLRDPLGGALIGASSTAAVTIFEPENPGVVRFSSSGYVVGEDGGSGTVTIVRDDGGFGPASVRVSTVAGGTATAGADYQIVSEIVSFADGDQTPKTVQIPILQDTLTEATETIALALTDASGAVVGEPSTATMSIIDDDETPGALQFEASTYSISEAGVSVTVTVTRSGGTQGAASARVRSSNGSAEAGTDYGAVDRVLEWADGDGSPRTVTVTVLDDALDEPNETFSLGLSDVVGAALGTPAAAVVTIIDNDDAPAGSVQFGAFDYSVGEGGGSATITVTRTGGRFGAASVQVSTRNGSASAGTDYTSVVQTVSWADGDDSARTVSVPILQDAIDEPNETVNLLLSLATGAAIGGPSSAVLTIIDDDDAPAGRMQFGAATYAVNEGDGSAAITVTRTGGGFGAASVQISTGNGSATAGADYTPVVQILSWADGDESVRTVSVPISQDSLDEPNETVNLSLSNATGAELGNPSAAVLTIVDDDEPPAAGSVQLSAATYSVSEGGGSALITLTRTSGSFGAASVRIATGGGTATASSDYTAVSQTVSWADGDAASKTVAVPILQDAIDEPNETVNLSLSNATGAEFGSLNAAVLTIVDDDEPPVAERPVLDLILTPTTIAEGGGPATVTLRLSRPLASTLRLRIDYDSVARKPRDLRRAPRFATIRAGQREASFTVRASNDFRVEPAEQVVLSVRPADGVTIGTGTATLTILDND